MKLDKKLNLVIPVEREGGQMIYVHSTPISRAVFEANYLPLAKTFTEIYSHGPHFSIGSGPRVAALMLRDAVTEGIADEEGRRAALAQIEGTLLAEIRRLSNVICPGEKGWETIPLQEALTRKLFDPDEAAEVENILVFFTSISSMAKGGELRRVLEAVSNAWSLQTVSSNCTGFASSLPTSTAPVSIGEKATTLPLAS